MESSLVVHKVSSETRVLGTDLEAKEVGDVHFSLEVGEDQENLQASLVGHKTDGEAMEVKVVSSEEAWAISREPEECLEEVVFRADPSLDLEPQAVWRACPLLEPGVHLAL